MNKTIVISIIAALLLNACEKENYSSAFSQKIVIQGYLYTHNSTDSIYLTELLPYGSDQDEILPINDAIVTITHNNTEYVLDKLKTEGMYGNTDGTLPILEGDTYYLTVSYDSYLASAETIVPEKPQNLKISVSAIDFKQIEMGFGMVQDTTTIDVEWDNPNNEYFYVVIESRDTVQESIMLLPDDFGGFGRNFGQFNRILTAPRVMDSYSIRVSTLEYFGRYIVRVYTVNPEYVDLYETQTQDSRNLTEPLSNVVNGLGVFTAFSSDSVFFSVNKLE